MTPPIGSIPQNPSPQVQVVLRWLSAISSQSYGVLDELETPLYTHELLPKSLGIVALTKTEQMAMLKQTLPTFREFQFVIGEIIEGPDIVVAHASYLILHASVVDTLTDIFKKVTSTATTIRGAPYKNEYIFTMYLANVNGGLKLVKIKEFIDSKFTSTFFGKTLAPDLGS